MTILQFLNMIDRSEQDKQTEIIIFNNGNEILTFTLDEFFNSHIKESHDIILNYFAKSFCFSELLIVVEF